MLERFLAIFHTLEYEEFGWVELLAADFQGKGCGLEFLVSTGIEDEPAQRWAVHCLERLDYRLSGSTAHSHYHLELHQAPHLLLAPYTEPRAQLYFWGRPRDPARTAVALHECSRGLVDRFPLATVAGLNGSIGLDRFLEFGTGIVAEGPVPVLTRYAEVLRAEGLETNILPTINPNLRSRDEVGVLVLGDSYVVGTHFDALLLSSESAGGEAGEAQARGR